MLNKIENIQSEMILYTLDEKGETFFTDSTHTITFYFILREDGRK